MTKSDELDGSSKLLQQLAEMCESANYSDVTLVIGQNKIPAHKCILAARSSYFRAKLYTMGDAPTIEENCDSMMAVDLNTIELYVPLEAFKLVLQFIYTGRLSFREIEHSNISNLIKLAHHFGIDELESGSSAYLLENLMLNNCSGTLNTACSYSLTLLENATLILMDRNSTEILKSTNFKTLTQESLKSLLKRDSFTAPEIDIFKAVLEWRKNQHSDSALQAIIPVIRFKLIDMDELLTTVKHSSILDAELLLEIVREKISNKNMNYRFNLEPDENVASAKNFNAKTIMCGINPLELLDGNVTTYDGTTGFTYHHITNEALHNCIIVELKSIYLINNIKILLWDRDNRSYSYYVEVSLDLETWERVYDCSNFLCRSWQNFHFKSCPIRYIKLVRTNNTVNEDFRVVELEAFYRKNESTLVNGLISPTVNVATLENGAQVIEGFAISGDTLDVLLNGDVENYTGGSGYVYNSIGSAPIIIQLAQPYHVGSCRLLLWDKDDRTYSFYVETSVNKKDWTMAVDKKYDRVKSWQELTFEPRPVVFFKIVGMYNSANTHFHMVHFETPSLA